MKNKKFYLWFNIALAFVAILASSFLVAGSMLNKNRHSVVARELDPKTVNVNFQLAKTKRQAQNLTSNGYSYADENKAYIPNTLPNQINNNDFVMLQNHKANQSLESEIYADVENVYIGFGSPYSEVVEELEDHENYGDRGRLVNITYVEATLNGTRFSIPMPVAEEVSLQGLSSVQPVNYYYEYLDLTNIKDLNDNPIEDTEGLYTFTFEYAYITKTGDNYEYVDVNSTYTISFYLMSQSRYATSYPTFNSAASLENKTNENVLQYFYNFNHSDVPTLSYDASLYNISYTLTKDNIVSSITSSLILNGNGTAELKYFKNNIELLSKTLQVNEHEQYFEHLQLSDLGIYEINIKYALSSVTTPNGILVLDHLSDLFPYDQNALDEFNNNPYETGEFAKSRYNLHVFGVKSYFIKNGNTLNFETATIKSNHSPFVTFEETVVDGNTLPVIRPGYYKDINEEHKNNFPTTNLPPVFFDYFGEFSFNGTVANSRIYRYQNLQALLSGNPTSSSPATKDSQISQSGYYEVIINYTYQNFPRTIQPVQHYQLFVFEISSSTPTVQLKTTNNNNHSLTTDANLSSQLFTNQNVYATWKSQTYFTSDITATLTHKSFNQNVLNQFTYDTNNLVNTNYLGQELTLTPIINNQPNGIYTLRVFYSENDSLFIEYEYVVDRTPIQDIKISAIEKNSSSNSLHYYINTVLSQELENKVLINQPFTLTYSQKESGAKITTTFDKIPFTAFSGGGSEIDSNHSEYKNYITTNSAIDHLNATVNMPYNLDYNMIKGGDVSFRNVFADDMSFIYLFRITDQAGNTATKFVVYDLSTPEVIVDPAPNNPYNIVYNDTTIKWGTHKAVPVQNSSSLQNANPLFRQLVNNNPSLFKQLTVGSTTQYYMLSPINHVSFNSVTKNQTHTFNPQTTNQTSATLLAHDVAGNFFSGEGSYNYIVRDSSFIQSATTIAKDNSLRGNIWMNLDNSIAIAFGKNLNTSQTNYGEAGEALDWYKKSTNSHQLRVTYMPGEEGTDYEVKNFSYTYYPKATSDYTNILNATNNSSYTPGTNEPLPSYPYSYTPQVANQIVTLSTLNIPGDSVLRVVSDIINPEPVGGNILTKEGFYVFKREYYENENNPDAYENDSIIRYYTLIVDREENINIASTHANKNVLDEDIEHIANPENNSVIYQTGSGIYFKFTPNQNDLTRMSAKQVQLRVSQIGALSSLFNSNKLPVKLSLPNYKYNDRFVLSKASDSSVQQSYINNVVQANNAPLYYIVTHNLNGRQTRVVDTLTNSLPIVNGVSYNPQFVKLVTNSLTGITNFEFRLQGEYRVELFSTKSAELTQTNQVHEETRYNFVFTIEHSAPSGQMLIKSQNDDSLIELETNTSLTEQTINFTSTNSKTLFFNFEDNLDEYKAQIDPNNLRVVRTDKNGVQTTIYSRANGMEQFAGITTGDSQPQVFSVTTDGSNNNKYSLDLTYFINQTATYDFATYTATIRFIGLENDFIENGVNFYERSFKVVVDRIKPVYNLQQLVNIDNQNFAANNLQGFNNSNYFYPINGSFVFEQSPLHGMMLDSHEIFVRAILAPANSFPNYVPSITPDNDGGGNGHANPPTFDESSDDYVKYSYQEIDGRMVRDANTMFNSSQTTYYEIIERDEAGNYSVYAVQYIAQESSPQISINYMIVGTDEFVENPTLLNDTNRVAEISGYNLNISEIVSSDFFLKAKIINNGVETVVYNNPNNNLTETNFETFINNIHNTIDFTNTPTKDGYMLTIIFVNRFGENFTLNYYVPGDVLKLETRVVNNERIEVSIPQDNQSTRIVRFYVWKFIDGRWSPDQESDVFNINNIPSGYLNYDDAGSQITNYSGGQSLYVAGKKYVFINGEFRFLAVDNFGRYSSGSTSMPYTYEGAGVVNNVKTISYGSSAVANGITYSAGPVTLEYQTRLYEIEIYEVITNAETQSQTKVLVTNLADKNIAASTNNATGVRTLRFTLPINNTQRQFEVNLLLRRINETTTYSFALNKILPNIKLTTMSGSNADPANSPFTENIVVSWDNSALDFSPVVRLTHTFTTTDGRTTTITNPSIANGHIISEAGQYYLTITNALGYTHESKDISFSITSGTVNIYRVEAVENGIVTVLQPSPLPTTYNYLGIDYYMEQYYVLNKFRPIGEPNNNLNYVDIVSNTDRQLTKHRASSNSIDSQVFRIEGLGVLSFVEIVYVTEYPTNSNFANLELLKPELDEDGNITDLVSVDLLSNITSDSQFIDISWNAYNLFTSENSYPYFGNIIYAEYYYNEDFVSTIYSVSKEPHQLRLTGTGVHQFKLYDLAGNKLTINNNNMLTINLINGIMFKVNNEDPLQNIIVNDELVLEIVTRNPVTGDRLYAGDVNITVMLNGKPQERLNIVSENGYKFTTQGYYEVKLSTVVPINGERKPIETKYNFTIINSKQKQLAFDIPINYGFEIDKLLYQNIEQVVNNKNALWLSSATNQIGMYQITIKAPIVTLNQFSKTDNGYMPTVQSFKEFSFVVDIHNQVPEIYASIPFGTSTTKNIVIDYNPLIIYNNIGESYIKITRDSTELLIEINEQSPNLLEETTLSEAGEYWVEIVTKDGKLVASYKLTKTQPLNSLAIIIISIVSVIVVGLSVMFIILRRRVKFR